MGREKSRALTDVISELGDAYIEASVPRNFGDQSENAADALRAVRAAQEKAAEELAPLLGKAALQ